MSADTRAVLSGARVAVPPHRAVVATVGIGFVAAVIEAVVLMNADAGTLRIGVVVAGGEIAAVATVTR
jgi:hypothetical protein